MEAEASYLQGRFAEAQTALERARYRAEERGQAYILQCCAMLALRLHLAAAGGAEPPDAPPKHGQRCCPGGTRRCC